MLAIDTIASLQGRFRDRKSFAKNIDFADVVRKQ